MKLGQKEKDKYHISHILNLKYGTNIMPDISPGGLGLFGIGRVWQFRICNNGKPHANPYKERGTLL